MCLRVQRPVLNVMSQVGHFLYNSWVMLSFVLAGCRRFVYLFSTKITLETDHSSCYPPGGFPTWAVDALVFTCWTLLFSVVLSVGSIFTLSVLSFSARLFVMIILAGFFSFSWSHIFQHLFHQSSYTISSIVFWIFSDFPFSALREWCCRVDNSYI